MAREKIDLQDSVKDIIMKMCEGNPGGLNVMMAMLEKNHLDAVMLFLSLDDMNIRGSQIWVGFKDHCGQDLDTFIKAIEDRDQAMCDTINNCRGTGTTEKAVPHGASFKR